MSQKIGNITLICEEPPAKCQLCGKLDELRPYGPDGKSVCYDCAMKDPVNTEIRMAKVLFGDDLTEEQAIQRIAAAAKLRTIQ